MKVDKKNIFKNIGMKINNKTKDSEISVVSSILIFLVTLLQLNSLLYFLEFSTQKWVILIVVVFPLILMNSQFIKIFKQNKNSFSKLLRTAILSVLFYIGIFFPSLNSFQMAYMWAAIGYIVTFFIIIYCVDEALEKIEWTQKETKPSILRFTLYFIIPASLYALFLIACYPGLVSPDSAYVLNQAVNNGPYNNLHPLLYTLSIRFMTVIGLKLGAIMALQCLLCALTYAYIAYSFDQMGLPKFFCFVIVVLLSFYPLNLMNTITFWKDIPYAIGVSLLSIEIVKLIKQRNYFKSKLNLVVLIFAVLITLIARHNGIVIIALTFIIGIIFFAIKKNKHVAINLGIMLAASIVFYFGALYGSIALLGDKYEEPEDNKVTQTAVFALRTQGLIAVYAEHGDTMSQENKDYISKYLVLEEVDNHIAKYKGTWNYRSRTKVYTNTDTLLNDRKGFNKGYIKLLKAYPFEVINAYLKTTGIVWSVPEYGYTLHAAFPHSSFDTDKYENVDINFGNFLPGVKTYIIEELYGKSAEIDHMALYWRPALFMLIILLFLHHAIKNKGYIAWLVVIPAIVNSLGYWFINEAQDARYVYVNFTVALIMIAFALMKTKDAKKESEQLEETT
ncbi:MAG: hypothetical protein KAQ68_08685 [Clostridiales bacterium]|nr:hypothetical protein [Clostridiales bacterium]